MEKHRGFQQSCTPLKRHGHLPLKQMSPVNASGKSVPCEGAAGWTSVGMADVRAGAVLRLLPKCQPRRTALSGLSGFLVAGRSMQQGV